MKIRNAYRFRGGSIPIHDMDPVKKALLDHLAPFIPANILLVEDPVTSQVKQNLQLQGHSVYLGRPGSIVIRESVYPHGKWSVRRDMTGLPLFDAVVTGCKNYYLGKNGYLATTTCPKSAELFWRLKQRYRHIDHATRIIALADKSQEIFRAPSPTRVLSKVNWIITAPTGTVLNGCSNLRWESEPSQPELFDSFLQLT